VGVDLTETTYHKKKIYVPAEVRERLGLRNGDRLNVVSLDRKGFRTVEKRILDALANCREVGVP